MGECFRSMSEVNHFKSKHAHKSINETLNLKIILIEKQTQSKKVIFVAVTQNL